MTDKPEKCSACDYRNDRICQVTEKQIFDIEILPEWGCPLQGSKLEEGDWPFPKTFLHCTCYMSSAEHIDRFERYVSYYLPRLNKLGAHKIIMVDDGSDEKWLNDFKAIYGNQLLITKVASERDLSNLPTSLPAEPIWIISFSERYGYPAPNLQPGWWRSFSFIPVVGVRYRYEKAIHIESDAYILTDQTFAYIRETNQGLNCLWAPKKDYPETSIQWFSQEYFSNLAWFWRRGKSFWFKVDEFEAEFRYAPEFTISFTNQCKYFVGDRYGDDYYDQIPTGIDYVCNIHDMALNKALHQKETVKLAQLPQLLAQNQIWTPEEAKLNLESDKELPDYQKLLDSVPVFEDGIAPSARKEYENYKELLEIDVTGEVYSTAVIYNRLIKRLIGVLLNPESGFKNEDETFTIHRATFDKMNKIIDTDWGDLTRQEQQFYLDAAKQLVFASRL